MRHIPPNLRQGVMILLAPTWLQIALASTTGFVDADPRGGLYQGGAVIGRVGAWTSPRVALGARGRATLAGVIALSFDGPPPDAAEGPLLLVTGGGFARVSPWGGAFVELEAFAGGAGWAHWHAAAGGTLSFGWTWWTGARRWGVEAFAEGAGGGAAWFGTGVALSISGQRPGDR